ncbi:MAG: hypothetical protein AUG75_08110 [Cyanobacteria bacterium 13_1_20CM_4_61_6]|nr:MAG: hypothetical protein AUG75_08110 [Cyanobacteria bacterium 13_1_20CM_4_61_6]
MYDCPVQCAFLTHKFTGLERDSESNLDHTWFRQYSSPIGRWMRPDPAGLAAVDPFNPQSWNRYVYVLNNPLAYRDPLGLECVWDDGSTLRAAWQNSSPCKKQKMQARSS